MPRRGGQSEHLGTLFIDGGLTHPQMPVGRFAKLVFLVPAVLLAVGIYSLASWPGCGSHSAPPPCQGNSTQECPPEPANGSACAQPLLGASLLVLGVIALPFAYLFYRSRFYTPIPP